MTFSTSRHFFDTDAIPPKIKCPSATMVRVDDSALSERSYRPCPVSERLAKRLSKKIPLHSD